MKNKKTPNSELLLKEKNGLVELSLIDENDISLKRTIHDMPHPRIRSPRRTKDQIRSDSIFMANFNHTSQKESLKKNIRGINNEINEHIQEIRKELKRIQSLAHYVICAEEILNELE
jgi:hypothetical protein